MLQLSKTEQKVLEELESGALPKVVALRLKLDRRTVENCKSRMRKKCFEAGDFLQMMKKHGRTLGLRISVKVDYRPTRRVSKF